MNLHFEIKLVTWTWVSFLFSQCFLQYSCTCGLMSFPINPLKLLSTCVLMTSLLLNPGDISQSLTYFTSYSYI